MDNKKIKEIKKRVEKATPGTWKVEKYYHDEPYEKYIKSAAIVCRNSTITRNDWSNPLESDLEFIAHARRDVPYLLKIIDELNEKINELNGGWIPVSERLPTADGRFEVTVKGAKGKRYVEMCNFYKDALIDKWGGKYSSLNVIAWRCRPEPWKGETDE